MIELLTNKDLKLSNKKSYKKDEVLFHELDVCNEVGFVITGEVVIKSYDTSGNEIIYNTVYKNEMFGNNLIFSSSNKYKGDVIATIDTEVLFLNKDNLLKVLSTNKKFLESYLTSQANKTKKLNSRVKLLSLDKAKDRFMFYLIDNHNQIEYESITSLAKELNIQRETLSRLINKLIKEKVIVVSNKTIKIK